MEQTPPRIFISSPSDVNAEALHRRPGGGTAGAGVRLPLPYRGGAVERER